MDLFFMDLTHAMQISDIIYLALNHPRYSRCYRTLRRHDSCNHIGDEELFLMLSLVETFNIIGIKGVLKCAVCSSQQEYSPYWI